MLVLITYDVSTSDTAGRRRLRRVARACQDHGLRVQYSVFECEIEPAQWAVLKARLVETIDPEVDSLRFYRLGARARDKVEHVGVRPAVELDEPFIL